MKIFIVLLLSQLILGTVIAQKKIKEPPALIDREIFFGDPEVTGAQLSPDGKFMSFIKPYNGTRNIWFKKANEAFNKAKPLSNDSRPVANYFWTRNSKYIVYVQDKGGNEDFQLFAINPNEKPDPTIGVPTSRNLTNKENSRVEIIHQPKNNPDLLIIGLNERDPAWHDLYELKISSGELKLILENKDRMSSWTFDQKDKLRLAVRSNADGTSELLKIEKESITPIYSSSLLEEFYPLNFDNDGVNVYMITNTGINRNLSGLVLFNTNSLKEKIIETDSKKKVDISNVVFSEQDNSILYTEYQDDKTRIYWKNKAFAKEHENLKKQLKGLEIRFFNSTKDEMLWLISAYSDKDPGSTYLYDRRTKKITFQYKPRPKIPIADLSEMKIISYKSSDNLEIPGYLTLPNGYSEKNLPLVVNPHGGPWARDQWGYNPYVQFLANRGYAVLQMNFRGSTGYGKKFIDAGNKQWGDKMQDDIDAGIKYLIKKGIVDPDNVAIFGGSYGGYATLAGMTFTPDLYACGVSIVGPSSLLSLLESIPPYWEAGRKIFYTRMGDPTTPEGIAQLKRQSPLYSVEKIKAPILVVQGANDPRVKKAESEQIVIALRDKKLPVEYLCAPDEGHGFARPVNNMAFLAATEKFLAKNIGGRYQSEMSPEVSKRLMEITVDIKSLKKPVKAEDEKPVIKISSISAHDLKPGKFIYKSTSNFLGELVTGIETIEIEEKSGDWNIKSLKELPIGNISDNAKIKKGSLINYTRDLESAGIVHQIGYTENFINVRKTENGKKTTFKINVNEFCFADGPITQLLVACLPLTESFKRNIINIDLDKMIPIKRVIEVKGIETILGQDCFKVEINSIIPDNISTTVWVTISDYPKAIKYVLIDPCKSEDPIISYLED
ncbi:MAG: S9 family peptidase [Saprospiraceae bacterium]